MINSNVSLIICTRNRPSRVQRLLASVASQRPALVDLVLVDSSDTGETFDLAQALEIPSFTYLRSSPGLPRQRNVGIRWLQENSRKTEIYAFLDDDVEIGSDYFAKVGEAFSNHRFAMFVSGFDKNLMEPRNSIWSRFFGLRAKEDQGRVLKSGIAIPTYSPKGLVSVDWAPGHSLNMRASILEKFLFNERIRMYGEDVDFCMRVNGVEKIYISSDLGVRHIQESSGREGIAAAEAFNAGFRYQLAIDYPDRVQKGWVLFSSFVLSIGYLLTGLIRLDGVRVQKFLGLSKFFARLLAGKPVVQSQ